MTREKIEILSSQKETIICQDNEPKSISRLLRIQGNNTEVENWLSEISAELAKKTETLAKEKEKLSEKLEEILESIPHCVQVSFSQ